MRTRPPALLALLAPLALAGPLTLAGPAPGEDAEPPRVALPVGIPVSLDGAARPAEWDDGYALALDGDAAQLRLKQHRGTLLLSLTMERAWLRGTRLWLGLCHDVPEMHGLAPGAVVLDYEPLDHTRPHVLLQRQGDPGPQRLEGLAVVRAFLGGRRCELELALKLEAIGLRDLKPQRLRLAIALLRGLQHRSPTWPAGLDITASVGKPPPDLISSARWARLHGWEDAGGPGAWPASTWDAWVAEDREITTRGLGAHAKALEITEESGRKLEKQDRDVERELLEPLDWIAQREPLHPYDVLVRAQALRHLNRHAEALGTLAGLATMQDRDYEPSVARERAITLEALERYEEAAVAWRAVAALADDAHRPVYEGAARRAESQVEARDRERAARDADARDASLPRLLLVTSRGPVLVVLHARDVPASVEHFLRLARRPGPQGGGFYDGTLFHRVLGANLAQGGDPRTRGGDCDADLSGPAGETIAVETNARHAFRRGSLGLARGPRRENASQFFVLTAPRPDMRADEYTCFGHVEAGMEAVDRLERCDVLLGVQVLGPPPPAEPPPGGSAGPR